MLIPRFAEICAYAMPGATVLLVCLTKIEARMMCQYISFEVGGMSSVQVIAEPEA
jgi:hypothetical protein